MRGLRYVVGLRIGTEMAALDKVLRQMGIMSSVKLFMLGFRLALYAFSGQVFGGARSPEERQ